MRVTRVNWCDEAAAGLADTMTRESDFDAPAIVRFGVQSGKLLLWRVTHDDARVSWAVTQTIDSALMVWCYQGFDAQTFARIMLEVARRRRLTVVRFSTQHHGLPRMLRQYAPQNVGPQLFEMRAT